MRRPAAAIVALICLAGACSVPTSVETDSTETGANQVAPSSTSTAQPSYPFDVDTEGAWRLVTIERHEQLYEPLDEFPITLQIIGGAMLVGNDGCNTYGPTIDFGGVIGWESTDVGCTANLSELAELYKAAVFDVEDSYVDADGVLILSGSRYTGEESSLHFVADPSAARFTAEELAEQEGISLITKRWILEELEDEGQAIQAGHSELLFDTNHGMFGTTSCGQFRTHRSGPAYFQPTVKIDEVEFEEPCKDHDSFVVALFANGTELKVSDDEIVATSDDGRLVAVYRPKSQP